MPQTGLVGVVAGGAREKTRQEVGPSVDKDPLTIIITLLVSYAII